MRKKIIFASLVLLLNSIASEAISGTNLFSNSRVANTCDQGKATACYNYFSSCKNTPNACCTALRQCFAWTGCPLPSCGGSP
jgi:hypothetical protein